MPTSKLLLDERRCFIPGGLARQSRAPTADLDDLAVEADAPDAALAPLERLGIRVQRAERW